MQTSTEKIKTDFGAEMVPVVVEALGGAAGITCLAVIPNIHAMMPWLQRRRSSS